MLLSACIDFHLVSFIVCLAPYSVCTGFPCLLYKFLHPLRATYLLHAEETVTKVIDVEHCTALQCTCSSSMMYKVCVHKL